MANMSSLYKDDLFKKFKLKIHRIKQRTYEVDNQHDIINSDEGSLSEIDELKRQENALLNCIQSSKLNEDKNILFIQNHKKLFRLCSICNDKATGIHYGLVTCDSCAGFFKRTIKNNKKYRCYNNGLCIVDKFQRNRCQYCRFRKCLIKGMVTTAAKYDRTPANETQLYQYKNEGTEQINNNSIVQSNVLFDINSFHYFDKLSTLDILFDNLRPLLNHKICLTKELIQKISYLLIDTFTNWFCTLPFYSIINFDFNQLIVNNQWSNYIILVIFYFLKINFHHIELISYEKCCEQIFNYTQNYFLSSLSNQILEQFLNFLSRFFDINITNTEFILLSILLILQSDQSNQINFNSLHEIYLKILYNYEINTFSLEQPFRYNRLLHLSQETHLITQVLITYQHFYLPFLLISN